MCEAGDKLATSSSFTSAPALQLPKCFCDSAWKSDMHLQSANNVHDRTHKISDPKAGCGEYYKSYEYELPVKEFVTSSDIGTGDSDRINSLCNKMLMKYDSKELRSDCSSFQGLDSHVKFFQTTVQEIFDTFYANMRDIEAYKKRYQEILDKTKAETIEEMEDFIKDMIQNILSSHASSTSVADDLTYDKDQESSDANLDNIGITGSVVESYVNENYASSASEDISSSKRSWKAGDIYSIFFVTTSPSSVAIKVNDRSMLSEINIKNKTNIDGKVASADNLEKLAAKKKQLAQHESEIQESNTDREIPIKFSFPKKNIYLNEDFHIEHNKMEKSFLSKICNYICKRFRKS